jgi:hypothetical protein
VANHFWNPRAAFIVAAALLSGAIVHTSADTADKSDRHWNVTSTVPESARAAYFRLPLRFESATAESSDAFVARGSGYAVAVSAAGASLLLGDGSRNGPRRVTMSLAGGNRQARASARRELPGVSNYLIGNDPSRWVTGVSGFGEVEYRGVYRGVDVVYYGNQQKLEFDFVVAPAASSDGIALAFDGASGVSVDPGGDLVIATDGGNLVQYRPDIYQDVQGARRAIRGGYVIRRDGTVGFRLGKYDRRLPLIIDPTLSYATYLGGVNQERGNGVAIDSIGNVIVAGATYSPDFPVLNAVQPQQNGSGDAFVVKLNPDGNAIVYSTYFGGTGNDIANAVGVDGSGNAYVAGQTSSWDLPGSRNIGPINRSLSGFVLKLDPAGGLAYATRFGGSAGGAATGIAVDVSGRAHVVGWTSSADFPVVNPWQASLGGYPVFRTRDGGGTWTGLKSGLQASGIDAFAFDPSQPGTAYAGSLREGLFRTTDDGETWTQASLPLLSAQRIYAIAVQGASVFAAGDVGLYRSRDHGDTWTIVSPVGFVTAVAVTQESPAAVYVGMGWSTNVRKSVDGGDTWTDTGLAGPVQLLAASGSTVYAATTNGLFRSTAGGAWVAANGTGNDVMFGTITALSVDPTDPQTAYAGTFYGLFKTTSEGAAWAKVPLFTSYYVSAIAIAPSDPSTVFVAVPNGVISHDGGQTWSSSRLGQGTQVFAVAFDPADSARVYAGSYMASDAFVATLSADGSSLEYASFIGGSGSEGATGIAIDPSGNRYITGDTLSQDFPTVNPIQGAFGGTWDSFVVKISPTGEPVYATYLGGWQTDYNARIAADAAGRAYVTGLTLSPNFPVVNAWQPAHGGGNVDVFVSALNESGSAFVYSTYLGGSGMEVDTTGSLGPAIAVTPAGEVLVTGTTQSTNFPVTPDAWHRMHAGGTSDVFVSRFDASGVLQYSTYLGGQGADYGRAIAVDSTGAIIVTGYTDSTELARGAVVQPVYAGSEDAFVVKISPEPAPPDTIAPATTIALSGTTGAPGWYKSPVMVSLSAVDNDQGRGVAYIEYSVRGGPFQRYTTPFTVVESGTRVDARATDWAGNVENPPASTTVKIDTQAPVISIAPSGTLGSAGWFKSAVTVTLFPYDFFGSGVASVEYRIGNDVFQSYTAPFVVSAEGTTQVTARATDANGNVGTSSYSIMIDTSAPRTSIAVSGTPGLGGWYKSPVTVTLSGVDASPGSGVGAIDYRVNDGPFQQYSAPFAISTAGTTRITARVTDRAGNPDAAPPTTTFMIDASAPRSTVAISGTPGLAGWYTSPVTVSLAAVDNTQGSGVASIEFSVNDGAFQAYTAPIGVSAQGATRIVARATDAAGNVEIPLPATVVSIDSTAPVLTVLSPAARDYLHSDTLVISFAAADGVSGVQRVSAALDGVPIQNPASYSLLPFALGVHTVDAYAFDVAGNQARQSVSFRIVATIDSLIAFVNVYAQQGSIDASKQNSLLAKLTDAQAALDRGNTSAASGSLRDFIDQCAAQSGKGVSPDAAALLTADAQYVLATF